MGVEEPLTNRRNGVVLLPGPQYDRATAAQIVGGLSRTKKMPCHSWGLPAWNCHTGAKLVDVEGSVCHTCYARKRTYTWPHVRQANKRRLAHSEHPDWVAAMAVLIQWQAWENAQPYFRWFDTGDLQDTSMLERITAVARATTNIQHWLPTKEREMVADYLRRDELPDNLVVRVSASMIDHAPPTVDGVVTSTVHYQQEPYGYACPAYDAQPVACGPCRACWDPSVDNVSYPKH